MECSWVVCTYNRTPLTEQFMEHNLARLGNVERPELIWIDNGSTDGVERLWEKYKPDVIIKRPNDCLSKSKNAAYNLCRGDWIIDLENDFFMPDNWLEQMLEYGKVIPNTGVMATMVACWDNIVAKEYNTPSQTINGKEVKVTYAIGPRLFSKDVFEKCGCLTEFFGLYGNEDFEICERTAKAGLINYLIPSMTANHGGVGEWDSGEYRENKTKALNGKKIYFADDQVYFSPYIGRKSINKFRQ